MTVMCKETQKSGTWGLREVAVSPQRNPDVLASLITKGTTKYPEKLLPQMPIWVLENTD